MRHRRDAYADQISDEIRSDEMMARAPDPITYAHTPPNVPDGWKLLDDFPWIVREPASDGEYVLDTDGTHYVKAYANDAT